MPNDLNLAVPKRTLRSYQHKGTFHARCLFCRLLFPIVVRHRHVLVEDASEARTLFSPFPIQFPFKTSMPGKPRRMRKAERI
jgi:hypothetical protein